VWQLLTHSNMICLIAVLLVLTSSQQVSQTGIFPLRIHLNNQTSCDLEKFQYRVYSFDPRGRVEFKETGSLANGEYEPDILLPVSYSSYYAVEILNDGGNASCSPASSLTDGKKTLFYSTEEFQNSSMIQFDVDENKCFKLTGVRTDYTFQNLSITNRDLRL
jgi:hypothetical protein